MISGGTVDSHTYFIQDDGTLFITGEGPMKNFSPGEPRPWESEIPQITKVIVSPKVESVGKRAFQNCDSIEEVILSDTVLFIEECAFAGCENLQKVQLSECLNSIGTSAFAGCSKLTNIQLPAELSQIGEGAFCDSGLFEIEIPEGVTSIPYTAFQDCTDLYSVLLPDTVSSIDAYAFANCTSLEYLELPEGLFHIGRHAFSDSGLATILLPSTLERIEASAFHSCYFLDKVTYAGVESQWQSIIIEEDNKELLKQSEFEYDLEEDDVYAEEDYSEYNFDE